MRGTRIRLAIALLLVGAIACGARAQIAVAQGDRWRHRGQHRREGGLHVGWHRRAVFAQPDVRLSADSTLLLDPEYHLLIDFDATSTRSPGLATEVETSDDNMTFTYTISDEFVWSDGEPVTAEDVAYTMNLYKSNHAYLPQGYLTLIDGDVRVVDDTHIQFDTLGPTSLYSGESPT